MGLIAVRKFHMEPLLEFKDVVEGVEVYRDIDKSTVMFVPKIKFDQLSEQSLGSKQLIQAGVIYNISETSMNVIRNAYPGSVIEPIPVECTTLVDPFLKIIRAPHHYTFALLNQLPFPKVVFSATLDTNAADYTEVLGELRQGWSSGDILKQCLRLQVAMISAVVLFDVKVDNKRFRSVREGALPLEQLTLLAISDLIRRRINQDAVELVVSIGGDRAERLAVEIIVSHVMNEHFFQSENSCIFDDGTAVSIWSQQQIQIGDSVYKYRGRITKPVMIELVV